MAQKRQREDGKTAEASSSDKQPGSGSKATVGQQTSHIKNKLVRAELYAKLKHKQKKQKKVERKKRDAEAARAEELGLEPPPKKQQKTLENTREKDVTMVEEGDEEVALDEADDEFAAHFARVREPKVLVTTCYKPSKTMFTFLAEMLEVLPCAEYYKRQGFSLKKVVGFAAGRDYSDLLVFNEDRKEVNGLLHVHLPDGPTAHYRISSLVLGQDIQGHGRASSHRPELVLNNFNTRLGRRVGRMLGSLFHQEPQFRGRRVATFHNQRDFIFFRHHRYIFEEKESKAEAAQPGRPKAAVVARMQELGPRFTLKLQSLQKGTFDSKHGEFEWVHKKEMDTSRRRFHL
ncbi:anticodon-binding protein [Scenedesmus sp. NREL 46B-D3]|nr:anticodon-binding protein [Scenedesmus sp. NREL 46B-D3]